jgi:hypothetical protein
MGMNVEDEKVSKLIKKIKRNIETQGGRSNLVPPGRSDVYHDLILSEKEVILILAGLKGIQFTYEMG